MTPSTIAILAAGDFGGLIAIAFMVISFIGWLSNLIKNGQQKPGPQPAAKPPRNKPLRDEIDAFLKDAGGRRQPPAGGKTEVLSVDDIEIIREPGRPNPQRTVKKKRRPPTQPAAPQPQPVARSAPGAELSQRHLSANVSQRLTPTTQTAPSTAPAIASQPAATSITQSVTSHLGAFTAEKSLGRQLGDQTTKRRETTADAIVKMFRQPEGARQLVMVNEILMRPKSLRRDRV